MQRPIRSRILEDVLNIIDEDIEHARVYINDKYMSEKAVYGWACRLRALQELRGRITEDMEDN